MRQVGHCLSINRTGRYRKVLCRDSARIRIWRMSTKGRGLTVTRKVALGHGNKRFASPLAAMSRKIRAYLALLNHHSLRDTQTHENLISWNNIKVACKEIKVAVCLIKASSHEDMQKRKVETSHILKLDTRRKLWSLSRSDLEGK